MTTILEQCGKFICVVGFLFLMVPQYTTIALCLIGIGALSIAAGEIIDEILFRMQRD